MMMVLVRADDKIDGKFIFPTAFYSSKTTERKVHSSRYIQSSGFARIMSLQPTVASKRLN